MLDTMPVGVAVPAVPLRRESFEDVALANLLRRRAREVRVGPDLPAAHLLVARERLVGALDDSRGVGPGVIHDEHRERLGAARAFDADDGAQADFGLAVERGLDVLGVDVQARGRDDDLLLAPAEVDVARRVHLAEVARAQPAAVAERLADAVSAPVAGRDVRAAHENLARLVEPHLLPAQRLADGAAPALERVVDGDERRRLRHPVPLHDAEPEPPPEGLGLRAERRAAGHERPESPPEVAVDAPRQPEPLERVRALGAFDAAAQV